jgi:hypothetical protein
LKVVEEEEAERGRSSKMKRIFFARKTILVSFSSRSSLADMLQGEERAALGRAPECQRQQSKLQIA